MAFHSVNPIIGGFSPDPSIVRIGQDFFLVNSSFHVFPGLPIYTSKDLVSWKHIGNAFHRREQLSLAHSDTVVVPVSKDGDGLLASGGLYAPTIRERDGVVYIVCTNVVRPSPLQPANRKENFIISTRDIWSNEWSDPVYFDFDGIDPSIFFDEDGSAYIHGSFGTGPWTKIHMFLADLETGKKLSEEKELWGGTGGIYPEGPHIYKKDGWYFLLISEGGTHDGHMITAARSDNIWGPYEPYDQNPILTARGTDEYIQYTGHSDLVQDLDGKWWAVCLGVRLSAGRYVMGRETFLTGGEWLEGGWPRLNQVKTTPLRSDGTELVRAAGHPYLPAKSLVDYLYIRDPDLSNYDFYNHGQTIKIRPSPTEFSQTSGPVTFVGKRQRLHEGTAKVSMSLATLLTEPVCKAGLAYYKDEHRYTTLIYNAAESEMVLETINKTKHISRIVKHSCSSIDGSIVLRVTYTELSYTFSYKLEDDAGEWSHFEPLDTRDMTDADFVGPLIGVFATAIDCHASVQFDNLEIE